MLANTSVPMTVADTRTSNHLPPITIPDGREGEEDACSQHQREGLERSHRSTGQPSIMVNSNAIC